MVLEGQVLDPSRKSSRIQGFGGQALDLSRKSLRIQGFGASSTRSEPEILRRTGSPETGTASPHAPRAGRRPGAFFFASRDLLLLSPLGWVPPRREGPPPGVVNIYA